MAHDDGDHAGGIFGDHEGRTGRHPVGGLSFHDVSGLWTKSLAHRLPGGVQAQSKRRRPKQAWVSCSGVGQLPLNHTDLEHNITSDCLNMAAVWIV